MVYNCDFTNCRGPWTSLKWGLQAKSFSIITIRYHLLFPCIDICTKGAETVKGETAGTLEQIQAVAAGSGPVLLTDALVPVAGQFSEALQCDPSLLCVPGAARASSCSIPAAATWRGRAISQYFCSHWVITWEWGTNPRPGYATAQIRRDIALVLGDWVTFGTS